MNKKALVVLIALSLGIGARGAHAQGSPASQSIFYVPLIGITSVPDPLALPKGGGDVTYHYAVKDFLQEVPLIGVSVSDDLCSPVAFVEGDDNKNFKLDYGETWRYACTTKISTTTQSIATAVGTANDMTATHKAYATVVVGSNDPAPLVSIVNITKVAYPLSLPAQGGPITFTYRVNNPGAIPLSDVAVIDDRCSAMSGKLGDTNGNGLLDTNEVWVYTCTTVLTETTTNTVTVTAFANGLKAIDSFTLTVKVALPAASSSPSFPETGTGPDPKATLWGIMSAVLIALVVWSVAARKHTPGKNR